VAGTAAEDASGTEHGPVLDFGERNGRVRGDDHATTVAGSSRGRASRTGISVGSLTAQQRGRLAVVLLAFAIAAITAAGLLGPSAAEAALPGRVVSPPFDFAARPPQWLVTLLLDAAVIAGAAGLASALSALRAGWSPAPRPLIRASYGAAAAAVLVPPMGSADHLVYAAYGRLVTTGGNPYTQTAHTLALHGDPIGLAVQPPWINTSSVYGPAATAQQALASWIGGDSVHTTVFVLALIGAAGYVAAGAMLRRIGDPVRVTLLFGLNPLLLLDNVNAAHLDAFGTAIAVAGIYVLHRRTDLAGALAAGAIIGASCAVKLSFGLAVLAGVWALRRRPGLAAAFVAAAAAAGLAIYLPYGTVAFEPARQAAQMISLGSAWRPLLDPLQNAVGGTTARDLISALGWLTAAVAAWLLAPVVRARRPGATGDEAVRALAVLGLAWALAAPYTLPWYDVVFWAPLAACAAGAVDLLAVARTGVLSLGYIPGLDLPLEPGLAGWANWMRADAAPVFSIGALAACAVLGVRARLTRRADLIGRDGR
jgi:hypothetical protein